ncbi:MAG: T9SS type A sorting domain-containing protein [Ignavibacteria bacterium]|nr:T9SS type A sorting domain-containing protein [Ignavibacteria bacterium]
MTKNILLLLVTLVLGSAFQDKAESRILNVEASNFMFTPSVLSAAVGDTVRWVRIAGSHTTTCNGTNGTIRPAGAAAWDAPLTSGNPTFSYRLTVPGKYVYICTPHAPDMMGVINVTTSSINMINEVATGFGISQNYPNPFNPETKIRFSIPDNSNVEVKVYDELGRLVEDLVSGNLVRGSYEIQWNASSAPSGIYYYRIQAGEFSETKKMILAK